MTSIVGIFKKNILRMKEVNNAKMKGNGDYLGCNILNILFLIIPWSFYN